MDFDFKEEHLMIKNMAREFARRVIRPRSLEIERTGRYPYDIIDEMAKLGMMGIPIPERYGGSGGDWVGMHILIEEISWGDMTLGALLDVTTSIVAQELYVFGTEEQRERWLIPIAKGERVGAFGLTEPNAGSDAAAIETRAELRGDWYYLNGSKQFITNIGLENASLIIVAAVSGRKANGEKIISTFIVPKDAQGFVLGKKYDKIAWHGSATHEVILDNCKIPKENLLGDPLKGLSQHLHVLQTGRISIAAIAVGLAQACFDESLRYAKERIQFGRPIFDFQAIQFKLADMAVAIELARGLYLKAAWLKDMGREHAFEASAAKLFASEMAERVASDAVQIHGGYGYMSEYLVSRIYRGAKLLQIVEGTSEVQRMIIGRIISGR